MNEAYIYFKDGLSRLTTKDFTGARDAFIKAASYDSNRVSIKVNLAAALIGTGEYEYALDRALEALTLEPLNPSALLNAGVATYELGRTNASLIYLDKALSLCRESDDIRIALARVYQEQGRSQDALEILRPSNNLTQSLSMGLALAQHYKRHRNLTEAEATYKQLLIGFPSNAELLVSYGHLVQTQGRITEAIPLYKKAADLSPSYSIAWLNLASALFLAGNFSEVIGITRSRLSQENGNRFLLGLGLNAAICICDWRSARDFLKKIKTSFYDPEFVMSPFPILAVSDDIKLINEINRKYYSHIVRMNRCNPTPNLEPKTGHKIRIAYISADFREHPVSQLARDLFLYHDRSRFEILGFSLFGGKVDSETAVLKSRFDEFFDFSNLSNERAVELIRAEKIDIAIDLMGYTQGARPEIFIQRCAPIQINYLGYPSSLASQAHDFIIADSELINPRDVADYYEEVLHLPCFMPISHLPQIPKLARREDFGIPNGQIVFGSFNNVYKLTAELFHCWLEILRQVEGSILWLGHCNETARNNLVKECISGSISVERIIFSQRIPSLSCHLDRIRLCDLVLDTYPYNGHTTTADSLWAGVPVLTCQGRHFASRVSSSLLGRLKLHELITHSIEEYLELAVVLGRDRLKLNLLRTRLEKSKSESTLFDIRAYLKDYEAQLERIYRERLKPSPKAT
jgi:protein O-GlcNAc transferase